MKQQQTLGILLSYLNRLISMAANLILIPMLISALTEEGYSLYKVIQAFAGPLMMFNLGLSTVTARAVARYRAAPTPESRREKEGTFAMAVVLALGMAVLAALLGYAMTPLLPVFFADAYSPAQLATAGKLLRIFAAAAGLHILSDAFGGCIQGRERFVFFRGAVTVQYLLRFCLMLALTGWSDLDVIHLALVDLALYGGLLAATILYCLFALRERPRLGAMDAKVLPPILSFSWAILLQAIISQVNNNLDTVILGAAAAVPRVITLYSAALTIFTMYESLVGTFSTIYFPKAAQLTAAAVSGEELTDFVIAPGRLQAMVALGILGGFALFGGDFIRLWIGPQYQAAHPIALVLMICVTVPMVQSVCVAILDARLKRLFRSAVLALMAAVNLILSMLLVQPLGYWGAALGTVISLILGHGILMNLYYARGLGLNVGRMLREIFSGTWRTAAFSFLICLPLRGFPSKDFLMLFLKCSVFLAVYAISLWKGAAYERTRR